MKEDPVWRRCIIGIHYYVKDIHHLYNNKMRVFEHLGAPKEQSDERNSNLKEMVKRNSWVGQSTLLSTFLVTVPKYPTNLRKSLFSSLFEGPVHHSREVMSKNRMRLVTFTSTGRRQRDKHGCSTRIPSFCQSRTPSHGMISLTFRVSLTIPVNEIQKVNHRHAQTLNPSCRQAR